TQFEVPPGTTAYTVEGALNGHGPYPTGIQDLDIAHEQIIFVNQQNQIVSNIGWGSDGKWFAYPNNDPWFKNDIKTSGPMNGDTVKRIIEDNVDPEMSNHWGITNYWGIDHDGWTNCQNAAYKVRKYYNLPPPAPGHSGPGQNNGGNTSTGGPCAQTIGGNYFY